MSVVFPTKEQNHVVALHSGIEDAHIDLIYQYTKQLQLIGKMSWKQVFPSLLRLVILNVQVLRRVLGISPVKHRLVKNLSHRHYLTGI